MAPVAGEGTASLLTGGDIPQHNVVVITARGQCLAIRAEGHAVHGASEGFVDLVTGADDRISRAVRGSVEGGVQLQGMKQGTSGLGQGRSGIGLYGRVNSRGKNGLQDTIGLEAQ